MCDCSHNTCKPTRTTISYYDVCSPFTPYMYAIAFYQFQLLGGLLHNSDNTITCYAYKLIPWSITTYRASTQVASLMLQVYVADTCIPDVIRIFWFFRHSRQESDDSRRNWTFPRISLIYVCTLHLLPTETMADVLPSFAFNDSVHTSSNCVTDV